MSKFPEFVIVGSMKCGTTVLWRNLDSHPDIFMGKNLEDPKKTSTEIRFWNNGGPHHTWKKKGVEWYKQIFNQDKCSGEKSANYIDSPEAFKRMKIHCPGVKIILCIRNPTERFYSEYQMQRDTAPKKHTKGFDASLKDKGYYKRGCYYEALYNNVLSLFPKDQIYLVIQERMYEDTQGELGKLCEFLGVGPSPLPVQEIKFKERDKSLVTYRKWKTEYGPMSNHARKYLNNMYKGHNQNLFDFLGYRIPEWSS